MRIPRSPVVLAALLAAFPSLAYQPLGERGILMRLS